MTETVARRLLPCFRRLSPLESPKLELHEMAKPLIVSIPHSLGKAEALRRLKSGMARATSNIPLLKFDNQTWTDDHMAFRARALGQVASGTVDVGESDVRLEVVLPWVLQKFAETVQVAFQERTRLLLEKK